MRARVVASLTFSLRGDERHAGLWHSASWFPGTTMYGTLEANSCEVLRAANDENNTHVPNVRFINTLPIFDRKSKVGALQGG